MLIYLSCHQQGWTDKGLSCVQGFDCLFTVGQGQSRAHILRGQAEEQRKWEGAKPLSYFQMAHQMVLYLGRGAERLGVSQLCCSLHRRYHQRAGKKSSSPNRHMVGKFILAHNCLLNSHRGSSPLNWIEMREMGPKHIKSDVGTSISKCSSEKKIIKGWSKDCSAISLVSGISEINDIY